MEEFQKRHPDWHYEPFLWNVQMHLYMHTDQPPFNDQRVRQAISMAMNRQEMIDTIGHGQGKMDTAVPAALTQWHLPVDQLGAGATYHQYNPQEARRLLTEAGYPNGFTASMLVFTGYGAAWADIMKRAKLNQHHHITREQLSVRDHMTHILRRLNDVRFMEFGDLFMERIREGAPAAVVVVHFIAMLELARESLLEITQAEPYAPIYVRLAYTSVAAVAA